MIQEKDLSKIKMLVMDVDGTLTDGKIYVGDSGEVFKAFNVKDGYRLINLEKYNVIPVIITGKKSEILAKRATELKINEVYQGVDNKLKVLDEIIKKYQISWGNIAYIGDDENDIDCMRGCYLSACPADAIDDVVNVVDYVCKVKGGEGAVREFIDLIVKTRSMPKISVNAAYY
jgi:3-deoxy-D-manno-octulosonate 8-phosphate phosphatase (KDO 8-P phosphatase)